MTVAILVPVLNRPHRVKPLLKSIAAATTVAHRVVFLTDRSDRAERAAIIEAGGDERLVDGRRRGETASYARKINIGVRETTEPFVFTAADDLAFHPGWFEAAREAMTGPVEAVGVNDLIARRPGRVGHATHFLMTRAYAERPTADGSPGPFSEIYDHSFVDDEFIGTAAARGVYAYAPDAHVEHQHPMNQTAPDDDTYRKGRAQFALDRKRFRRRQHLWT